MHLFLSGFLLIVSFIGLIVISPVYLVMCFIWLVFGCPKFGIISDMENGLRDTCIWLSQMTKD